MAEDLRPSQIIQNGQRRTAPSTSPSLATGLGWAGDAAKQLWNGPQPGPPMHWDPVLKKYVLENAPASTPSSPPASPITPIATPSTTAGRQKAATNAALSGNQPARVQSPGTADVIGTPGTLNTPPQIPQMTGPIGQPERGLIGGSEPMVLNPDNPNNYGDPNAGWALPAGQENTQIQGMADPTASGGGFMSSLKPQDWLGVAGLGIGGVGALLSAKQQGGQFDQMMALQRQQLAQNATQLNPYKQQGDLASLAMHRAMATGGPSLAQFGSATPTAGSQQGLSDVANQYLSDDALAGAKTTFDNQINGSQQQQQAALQASLQPEKKQGSGFWHKLAKIAAFAAPLIAAPFTGGASLALIGAGAGAASGALNGGGLKGALLGGAMGAIPIPGGGGKLASSVGGNVTKGLIGQTAKATLKTGLAQAGKSLVKSPAEIMALTNALRH